MEAKYSRSLKLAAAIVIALNFSSCGKYEDGPEFSLMSKKARLTGDWEVVRIDNQIPDPDYTLILEFEKDGDFDFTYSYDNGYNYGISGEWEWEDHREEIEVEMDGYVMDWNIKRLSKNEFWFEYDNEVWECEKKYLLADLIFTGFPSMDERFKIVCDDQFSMILSEIGCTLVISTYQAGKVIFIGVGNNYKLIQIPVSFQKPMGIALHGNSMAVATLNEIHVFSHSQILAKNYPDRPGFYDTLFHPRAVISCGQTDLHDLSYGDGGLWGVNTLYSCIATFDMSNSFLPRWKPPFISELKPEDRCHLNGMALRNNLPAYTTALSNSDQKEGWRSSIATTGVILEVPSGKIILDQLPMPHSPRLVNEHLYVLLSASGEVLKINVADNTVQTLINANCFIRGLAIHGKYLFIGRSMVRESSKTCAKLPFAKNLQYAGVMIFDLNENRIVSELKYQNTVEEIFDVALLEGVQRPGLIPFRDARAEKSIMIPDAAFWKK